MDEILGQVLADPTVGAIGAAIGVASVALWLAGAWWAHSDALRRTESELAAYLAAGWIFVSTPLMLPFALLAYTFARPQQSAADHRARALVAQLTEVTAAADTCPGCGTFAVAGWLRCPECATWLASPCSSCGSWSDSALEICPWCGTESREAPAVLTPVAAIGASARRRRGSSRGVGSVRPRAPLASARRGAHAGPDGRPMSPARLRA